MSGHHIWFCYRYMKSLASPTAACKTWSRCTPWTVCCFYCKVWILIGTCLHCCLLQSAHKPIECTHMLTLLFAANWVQTLLRHNPFCRRHSAALSRCIHCMISIYAGLVLSTSVWHLLATQVAGNWFHVFLVDKKLFCGQQQSTQMIFMSNTCTLSFSIVIKVWPSMTLCVHTQSLWCNVHA